AATSTTTIIVAPKGFGKTLLLKAKRLALSDPSLKILPSGQSLLDKPGGSPTPPSSKEYGDTRDNQDYWKNLWNISIALAILRHDRAPLKPLSILLDKILHKEKLTSPCDIFDALLSATYSEYQDALGDYNDRILNYIRAIHHNIWIFIDNIDEYYE